MKEIECKRLTMNNYKKDLTELCDCGETKECNNCEHYRDILQTSLSYHPLQFCMKDEGINISIDKTGADCMIKFDIHVVKFYDGLQIIAKLLDCKFYYDSLINIWGQQVNSKEYMIEYKTSKRVIKKYKKDFSLEQFVGYVKYFKAELLKLKQEHDDCVFVEQVSL